MNNAPGQEITTTGDYLAKGRSVDGRFQFLASSVDLWRKQGKLTDQALILGWIGELNRWNTWFASNIADTPWMPWQSTSELDAFDRSVSDWRAKLEQASGASVAAPGWQPVDPPGVGDSIAGALDSLVTLGVLGLVGFAVVKIAGAFGKGRS